MDYSNDDWWVDGHRKRIANKRRAWRDATQWKCNLSDSEARMEYITNIPVEISHINSLKISRWYHRMIKYHFIIDWLSSYIFLLEFSGAHRWIKNEQIKNSNNWNKIYGE